MHSNVLILLYTEDICIWDQNMIETREQKLSFLFSGFYI